MPVALPELSAELSQLEIEPIDVVSSPASGELLLEQLMMANGVEAQKNPIFTASTCATCCVCCCGHCSSTCVGS